MEERAQGRRSLAAGLVAVAVAVSICSPADAGAAAKRAAKAPAGKLVLRVGGLPRGERPAAVLVGPRQGKAGKRFRRVLARQGVVRLRGLRPGRYRLSMRRVEMRRGHGAVKRGATAFPVRKRLRVKVKAGRVGRLDAMYGTIQNPGAVALEGRIVRVLGSPRAPRGLVLRGKRGYRRGAILTAAPSARLPEGLLARVVSARAGARRTTLRLRPADIYDVAPNMHLRTRMELIPLAGASAVDCGLGGASVTPYADVGNVWAEASWTTTNVVLFGEVETGARVDLDFDATAGAEVTTHGRIECSLPLTAWKIRSPKKLPIPISGSIGPHLNGWIGPGARFKTEGKARIELGARASVAPLSAAPEMAFSSPRFSFATEVFAEMGIGFSFDAKLQVGTDEGSNLKTKFGNSLDFSVRPGTCSLDLKLGSFSLSGKLARWRLPTVDQPPLIQHNLGQQPCAAPPLQVPLARAEMSWGTDADVDLYAWDDNGTLVYFADRTAIPGAELVDDVIPSEGEVTHLPEFFVETESPGRRYTFGVCLYRGVPTDVTLKVTSVPDVRAGDRFFTVPLGAEGDGAIVTTMPEGGYQPPPGWCRSVASSGTEAGFSATDFEPGGGDRTAKAAVTAK